MFFLKNVLPYLSVFALTALIFVGMPLEFVKHYSIFQTGLLLASFYVGTMVAPFLFYRLLISSVVTKLTLIVSVTSISTLFISLYLNNGFYLSMLSLIVLGIGKNIILTYYDSNVIDKKYHLYRGAGSVAFVITALLVGWHYVSLNVIGLILAFLFLMNYFQISFIREKLEDTIILSRNIFSLKEVMKHKIFWLSILFHRIGMGIFISFAGIFVVKYLHYSELDFSIMWIVAATLEGIVLLFYFQFLPIATMIRISLFATIIRFLLIFAFPEYFFVLLISQGLHVFSYAIYHVNILKTINLTFREQTPINLKIYNSISEGLALVIGSFIGVFISYNHYFFFILSIFTFISFILFQIALNKKEIVTSS